MDDDSLHPCEQTLAWLNSLRPQDVKALESLTNIIIAVGNGDSKEGIERIRSAIVLAKSVETGGRIVRWFIVGFGSATVAFATFQEQFRALLKAWGLK
jgi:hypothetical protein